MSTTKRNKGFGTLEKRRGIYLARWTVDGKRFAQSTGTADRRTAERKLAEFTAPFRLADDRQRLQFFRSAIGGVDERIQEIREQLPGITIAEAWNAYANAPERPDTCTAQSLEDKRSRWDMFARFMAKNFPDVMELRNVTRAHVVAYVEVASVGKSAKTFNTNIRVCRNIWRTLAENPDSKLPDASPFDRVKKRREVTVSRRALTADELYRVLAEVKGEWRTLFAIGIYTGLRLADAATLEWRKVDMLLRMIKLTPRKTARFNKEVEIPIHPSLYAMLAETPIQGRVGYVLPTIGETYDSGLRRRRSIVYHIKAIYERCGIKTTQEAPDGGNKRSLVGFHSLRHSAVSLMANAGAPLAVVQRIVGHSSVRMTNHYFHTTDAALTEAIGALPDMTGTMPPQETPAIEMSRVSALKDIADAMNLDELREAKSYLERKIVEATPVDVVTMDMAAPDYKPLRVVLQPHSTIASLA